MSPRMNDLLRTQRSQNTADFIDQAATPGRIQVFEGPKPAVKTDTPAGLMLSEVVLSSPAGSVVNGQFTLTVPAEDIAADETGIAGHFRIVDGDGVFVIDGLVGVELSVSRIDFIQGEPFRILSCILNEGNV